MKALLSMATLSLALFLSSCSFTQQAQEGTASSPEARKASEVAGNPFSTRSRRPAKDTEEKKEGAETPAEEPATPTAEQQAAVPTAEQQAAAESVLAEAQAAPQAVEPAAPQAEATYAPQTAAGAVPPPSGGLRMGRIAPQEEAASSSDAPAPAANSVELRGFRSPKLPSGLPMNIDGKLTGQR